MYLVIAEKPSVSRAIAEVIGAQEREDGYLLYVIHFFGMKTS